MLYKYILSEVSLSYLHLARGIFQLNIYCFIFDYNFHFDPLCSTPHRCVGFALSETVFLPFLTYIYLCCFEELFAPILRRKWLIKESLTHVFSNYKKKISSSLEVSEKTPHRIKNKILN